MYFGMFLSHPREHASFTTKLVCATCTFLWPCFSSSKFYDSMPRLTTLEVVHQKMLSLGDGLQWSWHAWMNSVWLVLRFDSLLELVNPNMNHTFQLHAKTKIIVHSITLGECSLQLASFPSIVGQCVMRKEIAYLFQRQCRCILHSLCRWCVWIVQMRGKRRRNWQCLVICSWPSFLCVCIFWTCWVP